MDHYISSLTGILKKQIIKAYGLEEVLTKMMRWIGEKDAVDGGKKGRVRHVSGK